MRQIEIFETHLNALNWFLISEEGDFQDPCYVYILYDRQNNIGRLPESYTSNQ